MTSPRALIVLTSHADLGDSGRPTGFWYDELAAAYYVLRDGGIHITLASPAGGQPPADPASLAPEATTKAVERFRADPDALTQLATTTPLSAVNSTDIDGIFLAGGHGTMWDFPTDPHLARILTSVATRGVIGAVCHGAAGLLGVLVDDRPLVTGRRLTAFSDGEEQLVEANEHVPFSLEQRLRADGAHFQAGTPFHEHTAEDARLVTGQNPASTARTATLLLGALQSTQTPVL